MTNQEVSQPARGGIFFLILTCFFLSGLSGLTYEILWTRMIVKIIGSAPFAVSILLTIFMGGLGLGSYLAGRHVDRVQHPFTLVKLYGVLELVIGVYALLVPLILQAVLPLQAIFYNSLYDHFILYNLLTLIVCAALLGLPVICMGATLPILCRFYVASLAHIGTHTGRLYGLNTIGAAGGALLSGFWLIDLWGIQGTLIAAVAINVVIGLACLGFSAAGRQRPDEKQPTAPAPEADTAAELPRHASERRAALVIFTVSGFCAMAIEVIWTRLLGLLVGPTTYSFTIVLVTFITGLALGSMIFGYLADRVKNTMRLLLSTQIAAALLTLGVSQLLGTSQLFFAKLIFHFNEQFAWLNFAKAAVLFAFMILPTLCFGAAFPLVNKIYTRSITRVGRSIGFAYMLNTLGALCGPFCAGFILIPLIGKEAGLGAVVALQLATALAVAGTLAARNRSLGQFSRLAVPALAGLILCFFYPAWNHHQLAVGRYHRFKVEDLGPKLARTGWLESLVKGTRILSQTQKRELLHYGDGIGGFTTVVKYPDAFGNFNYVMANSGKMDASSRGDMATQTLLAHIPLQLHPNPQSVMVVGLASGITAGEVLHYPVAKLDILEINNQVTAASKFFTAWNNNMLADPRSNLIVQDARAHLQLTRHAYDVIISEPSNPWMAGLAALFTRDFFNLAKDRLTDAGVFVQWMHAYQMDWETFAMIGRTFAGVFPDSLLVHTDPSGSGGDYLLVGFKGPIRPSFENTALKQAGLQKSMNAVFPASRQLYRLVVSEDLPALFGSGPIHTDTRPRLEFAAPRLLHAEGRHAAIFGQIRAAKALTLTKTTNDSVRQAKADVDTQIEFAAFALSVHSPFRDMVDLSKADPPQKTRYYDLMKNYCAANEIDYELITDNKLRDLCLATQIEMISAKLDRLPDRRQSAKYLGGLYYKKGDPDKAGALYKSLAEQEPDSASAHNNLGAALAAEGRLEEAVNHYSEALRLDPDYVAAHSNFGAALVDLGRLDEAIRHYHRVLALNPQYLNARYNLANALFKKGRTDDAVNQYQMVLRSDTRHLEAHFMLGKILADQGRMPEAIEHFTEALRADPDDAEAHSKLGVALGIQGRMLESVEHLSEALRIEPANPKNHYNLGIAHASQGRMSEAIGHFNEALKLDPDDPQVHTKLGVALARQGNFEAAVIHYNAVLKIDPNNAEVHFQLGLSRIGQQRREEAVSHFSEALRLNPGYVKPLIALGAALARKDRLEAAVSIYSEILRVNPGSVEAHYHLGLALAAQNRLAGAVDHFSEALRLNPEHPKAHNDLGVALARQGRLEEAVGRFTEALERSPESAEVHNNLGVALARQGKFDAAAAHFQAALNLRPDYAGVRKNLQRAQARRDEQKY